ncbi:hypothetical protein [Sodalis sp.]|uniref:hypothetical protein n=1 Tax=Sodalis sp. (in: enterobacteria) TaxID=1898979 RepID=UPI0038739EC5
MAVLYNRAHEPLEAGRINGADVLVGYPNCRCQKTNLAALFVITFYLRQEPISLAAADYSRRLAEHGGAGMQSMIVSGDGATQWNQVMAAIRYADGDLPPAGNPFCYRLYGLASHEFAAGMR